MRGPTEADYRERIGRVLVYVQEHLDEPLSLEALARRASFSPFHFHRIFRGMVGEALYEHVRRLRLERAALRLKNRRMPVIEVALEAGYETHAAFTRAFHAHFGVSPTEFRRARAPLPVRAVPSGVHHLPGGGPVRFDARDAGGSEMEASIVTLPERRVAFVRHNGPYMAVGQAWGRLFAWAAPRGLFPPRTAFFGLCWDDPEITPAERLRYDACCVAPDGFAGEGEIGAQVVPGGEFARTVHAGPYETLGDTYARLCGEWIPAQGREIRDAPSIEIYLNDPRSSPPDQLRTEVYVPLVGEANPWLESFGRSAQDPDFDEFVQAIESARRD